eukprot:COSAG04_NODE_623_length_11808_cov_2.965838_5_plen_226_part_00
MSPNWALMIVATAFAGGVVLVMEMRHSDALEGVRDQHSAEMADTRRMLADALQSDRLRAREVSMLETRLALLEREREIEKNAASSHRVLQGDDSDVCLDPSHVAVAASDMAWAVSRAFDRFLGGATDTFVDMLARVAAIEELLEGKADIGIVDALSLVLAAAPAAEAERAAVGDRSANDLHAAGGRARGQRLHGDGRQRHLHPRPAHLRDAPLGLPVHGAADRHG